jgi:hypothetical protein
MVRILYRAAKLLIATGVTFSAYQELKKLATLKFIAEMLDCDLEIMTMKKAKKC